MLLRMATWTKKIPGTSISVGGRDVPLGTPEFDPKKLLEEHTAAIRKDPSVAGDNDPPASPAIVGPGFSWHKLPQQKQLTTKRRPPRLITGPNSIAKDTADSEPTDIVDGEGRPRWMQSPGYEGKDPTYRSQKPGAGGNEDELFSKNINDNPTVTPMVDPATYYIW
jgi:hypothetical protein